MPLDMSQPLHWDEEDVVKWLGTFKGKLDSQYGKSFAAAGLTGEALMKFEGAAELGEAAGFGTKKKDAKNLRTIWQGISTLREKTKEKNYITTPPRSWDSAKFLAWLHSPSVNLGKYAERFKKVHAGDDYGSLVAGVTDEMLESKFLMADPDDRRTFFRQLEILDTTRAASRGKGMLSNVFGGGSDASPPSSGGGGGAAGGRGGDSDAARKARVRPKGVGKLQFQLGSLSLGGFNTGGSEQPQRVRSTRDALDDSTDEDTPVRSARAAAPEDAAGSSGKRSARGRPAGVGLLSLPFKPSRGSGAGGGGAEEGKTKGGDEDEGAVAPAGASGGLTGGGGSIAGGGMLSSRSRGGPKPKGLGGISFGALASQKKRAVSPRRRESLSLLDDSDDDDEGQEINLSGSDEEGNDFFDEDADLGASAGGKRDKYSTGTFSDSGTFQLQGSHEINEYGILSNSAAVELRSYESKLENKLAGGGSPAKHGGAGSGGGGGGEGKHADSPTPPPTMRPRSRSRAESGLRSPSDAIIMANQIIQREQLGRGAGGIVYRAIHAPTLRVVALKKVRVQDAAKKAQVMTEVEGLRCNMVDLHAPLGSVAPCPCLLTFHGAYTNPQSRSVSLLLEFMDGGDLNDFTEAGQKVPEPLLANIAYRLITGLTYLHKNKQVHRDIKPHNVLMHKSGMVKISDLGIAKAVNEKDDFTTTFTGTTLYMSPERLKGDPYGYSADIWSVGLTVMTLAMGRTPIEANGFWGISAAIVDKPPPRLPVNGYSRELRDFCDCCLKNDPDKRLTAPMLLKHAWIRRHVADNKRQNLTSTVVRNNFMGGGGAAAAGPASSQEAMQALGATWSKLSSTTERADMGSKATRNKLVKVQEDVEEIRKFFFEKHADDPAYLDLRPSREAIMCYIKQSGLLDPTNREKCLKIFKRAKLL